MEKRKTLEQIRTEGLQALRERLGPSGMVRFISLFEAGQGDYARERHAWVDATTLDDLRSAAGLKPRPRKRRNGSA